MSFISIYIYIYIYISADIYLCLYSPLLLTLLLSCVVLTDFRNCDKHFHENTLLFIVNILIIITLLFIF